MLQIGHQYVVSGMVAKFPYILFLHDIGLGLWYLVPLSTIFQSYFVAVSFIGGGNQSTWRKPHTPRPSRIRTHNVSGDRH